MSILAVIGRRREALKRSASLVPWTVEDVVPVFDVGGRRYLANSREEAEQMHLEWLRAQKRESDFETSFNRAVRNRFKQESL